MRNVLMTLVSIVDKFDDDEEEGWRCMVCPNSLDPELQSNQALCYLPVCCLLISKWPYFTLMKDLLSK